MNLNLNSIYEENFEVHDNEYYNSLFQRDISNKPGFFRSINNLYTKTNIDLEDERFDEKINDCLIEDAINTKHDITVMKERMIVDQNNSEIIDNSKINDLNEDVAVCLTSLNCDNNPTLTKCDESNSECEIKSSTIIGQKKYAKKSKTTEFSYLLERKAFRMMRKYYKEKFEFENDIDEYKKNLPLMTSNEFNTHVCKFMETEFSLITKLLSKSEYEQLRDALKTIILCDRYNKKEKISEGLNFEIFRKVLHKYNTRNLNEYLSVPSNSFLYTHFFLIYGKKSSEEQEDVQKDKFMQSMRHLMKEASKFLKSNINSLFEEIYISINN